MTSVWKLCIGILIIGIVWLPVIANGSTDNTGQNFTISSNSSSSNDSVANSSMNSNVTFLGTNQTGEVNTQTSSVNENFSNLNITSENSTILGDNPLNNTTTISVSNNATNTTSSTDADSIVSSNKTQENEPVGDNIPVASGTVTCISVGAGNSDQRYPSIYENNLVWLDFSNNEQAIHLYNISTGTETVISNNSPYIPIVYKNLVGYTFQDSYYGSYCINIYDILTNQGSTITPVDGYNRDYPSIYEDRVVYMDNSRGIENIAMFNITTNKTRVLTDESTGPDHLYPAIYGDWVVWYSGSDNNASLQLYNLVTGTSRSIESTCTGITETPPSIYGDRVVWQDHRDQNFDIYLYNITTGLETLITPDTPGSDQMHPAIYANYIV
ncbi:MAG TPA: hypothetical protein VMC42_07750, partial [Methanoregulaceae archaeon]|nr:hypothetical protein [Methanoregulaceae archaeon]